MAMSTCRVCGRSVRKTVLAMILRNGRLKSARVCLECESKLGVTIVVAREAPHCKCGNPATKCHVCAGTKNVDRKDDVLKTIRGQLAALTRVQKQDGSSTEGFIDGKIEAYESVIALLEGKAA